MPWRFSKAILLARTHFQPGDAVPGFLVDPAMLRYLRDRWPEAVYDDAAAAAPAQVSPAAAPPTAESPVAEPAAPGDFEAFHESRREWEQWWAQHKEDADEETPDDDVR